MDRGVIVERADDFVGDLGQEPRHGQAVLARLQALLGDHPAPKQRAVQQVLDGVPRALAFGRRDGAQLRAQPVAVDDVFDAGGLQPGWHVLVISPIRGLWRQCPQLQDMTSW